jgi:rubrerythrin
VLELRCPDCGHEFRSLVLEGTKMPEVWVCSQCDGRRAEPTHTHSDGHPWSGGSADVCCG